MSRQSIKLHYDLESLATSVESLRRRFILSGPTPSLTKSSEHFSRLFSLHRWMENFTTATGLGFISKFNSLWTKWDLFKPDGLHLNRKGTGILTQNFINFRTLPRPLTPPHKALSPTVRVLLILLMLLLLLTFLFYLFLLG